MFYSQKAHFSCVCPKFLLILQAKLQTKKYSQYEKIFFPLAAFLFSATIMLLTSCNSKPQTTFKGIDLTLPYSTIKMKLESTGCDFTIRQNHWGRNDDESLFNTTLYDNDCECMVIAAQDTLYSLLVSFPEDNFSDDELSTLYQQIMLDLNNQYGEATPHTNHVDSYEINGVSFHEYDYTLYVFETKDGYVAINSRNTSDKNIFLPQKSIFILNMEVWTNTNDRRQRISLPC